MWQKMEPCPGIFGVIQGFKLRSQEKQGYTKDDLAATDLHVFCNKDRGFSQITEVPDVTYGEEGDWTEIQMCEPGFGVCGIQTQVEENQNDGKL